MPSLHVPFWLYYFNIDDIDLGDEAREGRRRGDPQRPDRVPGTDGSWNARTHRAPCSR